MPHPVSNKWSLSLEPPCPSVCSPFCPVSICKQFLSAPSGHAALSVSQLVPSVLSFFSSCFSNELASVSQECHYRNEQWDMGVQCKESVPQSQSSAQPLQPMGNWVIQDSQSLPFLFFFSFLFFTPFPLRQALFMSPGYPGTC